MILLNCSAKLNYKLSNGRDKGLRGGNVGGGVTTDSSDLVKLSNGRYKGLRGVWLNSQVFRLVLKDMLLMLL